LGFPLAATHQAAEDSKGLSGFFLGFFFSPLAATHQAAHQAAEDSKGLTGFFFRAFFGRLAAKHQAAFS
jgi:hypothetical protein